MIKKLLYECAIILLFSMLLNQFVYYPLMKKHIENTVEIRLQINGKFRDEVNQIVGDKIRYKIINHPAVIESLRRYISTEAWYIYTRGIPGNSEEFIDKIIARINKKQLKGGGEK